MYAKITKHEEIKENLTQSLEKNHLIEVDPQMTKEFELRAKDFKTIMTNILTML